MGTKKTSPAQLQRDIDAVLAGKGAASGLTPAQRAYVTLFEQDVRMHPTAYKEMVRADPAAYALQVIGGLDDDDVRQFTRDLRAEMRQVARHAGHSTKRRSYVDHSTKKTGLPGVSKWNMSAGGTSAAAGKHGYSFQVPQGTYYISPYTTRLGRHAGYLLKFAATGGRPRGSHGGLWHDLGSHRSPQTAAKAAAEHHAGGFE